MSSHQNSTYHIESLLGMPIATSQIRIRHVRILKRQSSELRPSAGSDLGSVQQLSRERSSRVRDCAHCCGRPALEWIIR